LNTRKIIENTKRKPNVGFLFNFIQQNKVKASGGCHRFSEVTFRASSKKSGHKYAKAYLIIDKASERTLK